MCATALLVHIQICIAFVSSGFMATRTSPEFFFAVGARRIAKGRLLKERLNRDEIKERWVWG